jgi:putative membrane protein
MEMKSNKFKDSILLYLKGISMGAADVVPGVSGGTMAFILGIYEELIHSIHTVTSFETIKRALKLDFKYMKELPWKFLLTLGAGIFSSIILLAKLIQFMLLNYPEMLWGFFFGLVAASIFTVIDRVNSWNIKSYVSLILGTIFAFLVISIVPTETPNNPFFLFLCGAIAICAMILPGISGSFLLVILGKYKYILSALTTSITALKELNLSLFVDNVLVLVYVGFGAIFGLGSFVKLLDVLFKKFHDLTVATLIGFMMGSLWKIWPWKEVVSTYTDRHGVLKPLVEKNIFPSIDSGFFITIALMVFAFVLIVSVDKIVRKKTIED